jgi:hypothetical protein
MKRILVVLIGIASLILAGCSGTSSAAKYQVQATAVSPHGQSAVGVAFQVKNVGSGSGSPSCTVTAAASSTDGGVNPITLDSIAPGHFDYVASADDIVTLSGAGASEVTLPGGVSIKCT